MKEKEIFIKEETENLILKYCSFEEIGFEKTKFYPGTNISQLRQANNDIINYFSFAYHYYQGRLSLGHRTFVWVTSEKIHNIFIRAGISKLFNENKEFRIDSTEFILCTSLPRFNPNKTDIEAISKVNLLDKKGEIDLETLKTVAESFKYEVENKLFPFFNKLNNINDINEKIINKGLSQEYLYGMFGFKQMAIMKLCGNPAYDNFITEYERKLENGVFQNKQKYQPFIDFFRNLKLELENCLSHF